MENINIIFVTDEKYFKHMIITMESLLRNISEQNKITFFILNTGIKTESLEFLNDFYLNNLNVELRIIEVEKKELKKYTIKTHVSLSAYAKVYISELVKDIDKAIYLDCDLIVKADISELWNQFENDVSVKAVWNPFYNYDNKYLGIYNDKRTFNSGVMLLNLELMRKRNATSRLVEFLDKYHDKTRLHDQAAYNAVFKDDWKELDIKWNCQVSMLKNHHRKLNIEKREYYQLFNNPSIIHFTSNSKPWQFRNSHPFKKLYKEYYSNIYRTFPNNDINMKSLVQKIKELFTYKFYYYINHI